MPTEPCLSWRLHHRSGFWIKLPALMLLFAGVGCRQQQPAANNPPQSGLAGSADAKPALPEPQHDEQPRESAPAAKPLQALFDAPQFKLTDQAGEPFESRELAGQVWVANFIFTQCQQTCPKQTAKLAELQERTARWPHGNRVRFLSFTVDPARDTPEHLRNYAERHAADPVRWKFLTGDRSELWRISGEGFKLPVADNSQDASNPITHSSRFILVDAVGKARGVYDSLQETDTTRLITDLQTLLAEPVPNAADPVQVGVPPDVFDPVWLRDRQAAQMEAAADLTVPHQFQFHDRSAHSGIDFINRPVRDAAKDFKSNHYDHANGGAAADVDGDGLIDLYFTSQVGGNQLWRNLGTGRFENITETAGVGLVGRVSVAASFADTDNDGDPDLYVTTTRHGNAYFVNDGQGRFRDHTEDAGLTYSGHSSAADFFDYDRDGRLDLLLTNVGRFTTDEIAYNGDPGRKEFPYYVGSKDSFAGHLFPNLSERSLLFHNEGENRFRNVSDELGFTHDGWSGDATPLDANRDGWIDLYVLNMQGNDAYYENVEGRRFAWKSIDVFPDAVWGGMGVKSFDYDNDGELDLYVTNMHADMWELGKGILGPGEKRRAASNVMPQSYLRSHPQLRSILGSALYQSGQNRFQDVAEQLHAENYWPWGPSVGDLNADGYQDIFVASCMNYPYRYHVNSVLLNERGTRFREAEFVLGIEPRPQNQTAFPWFTLDASGADAEHPLSRGRTGEVVVWGSVGTRSAVIFDLDRDGDLDIVTIEFNSPPRVLVSDLKERLPKSRHLEIQLRGTRSNRDGLGAKVEVTIGDRTLTQVHDGQSGYLSQSSQPLYFGLGDAETVDQITVHWLGGVQQTLSGPLDADQQLLIVEE